VARSSLCAVGAGQVRPATSEPLLIKLSRHVTTEAAPSAPTLLRAMFSWMNKQGAASPLTAVIAADGTLGKPMTV
jgi:hypothetical protein